MPHGDLRELLSLRIKNVDRAGHAGVEGMDGAQDFDRLRRIGDGCADQGCLVGPALAGRITGRAVQVEGTIHW